MTMMTMNSLITVTTVTALYFLATTATAFAPPAVARSILSTSTSSTSSKLNALLSVTLEKPLGLLLEEMEEGAAMGVRVQELVEGGSAIESDYKDQLVGLKVASVMGDASVATSTFDTVMEKIIDAPSPITIEFEIEDEIVPEPEPMFAIGESVTIRVLQEGKPDLEIANARVGDNLRKTLLENDVELYRGMKKKFGNCGGGGQCSFCAIEMTDTTGWGEQSDWEDDKIGKKLGPDARLACMNNIQGPATVRTL